MARLTAQQKLFYEKVLLDSIEDEDFDGKPLKSPKAKFQFVRDRFKSEYGWAIQRSGQQKALIDWLQGLAINIPFYNSDIIELAKKSGSLPENATETQEDKLLENYWSFMASQLINAWKKYKVN